MRRWRRSVLVARSARPCREGTGQPSRATPALIGTAPAHRRYATPGYHPGMKKIVVILTALAIAGVIYKILTTEVPIDES